MPDFVVPSGFNPETFKCEIYRKVPKITVLRMDAYPHFEEKINELKYGNRSGAAII